MYVLSEKTKLALDQITANKAEQLTFSHKRDLRKIGRGNPLLSRRRFKTIESIDRELDKLLNVR